MISLKLVIYYLHEGVFIGPFDRQVLPIGTRVVLADSRVGLFGEHDPIPVDSPFAYRVNYDPGNPRFDKVVDDPAGLEYPCFSIGFRPGWWTRALLSDANIYALAFDVEEGGLGVDYALWDNVKRGEGFDRIYYHMANTGVKCEIDFMDERKRTGWQFDYLEENPLRIQTGLSILYGAEHAPVVTPPPDIPILPLPEPVVSPPALPVLADGPTEGMDVWAAWRDGRANGLEVAARLCDNIPALATAFLIRRLKMQP